MIERIYRGSSKGAARHQLFEGFGEKHTRAEWTRLLGLPRTTLWRYLAQGMSVEEVATLRNIEYKPASNE
jgi:hypothetical protein